MSARTLDKSAPRELRNIGHPEHGHVLRRTSYYTNISIEYKGNILDLEAKVDTGASYTVIGLDCVHSEELLNAISTSDRIRKAYDASKTEIPLKGVVMNTFTFAEDIALNNIIIYFSKELGNKVLLGMDILSLFDFQYKKEVHEPRGVFLIHNAERTIASIADKLRRNGNDCFDPGDIFELDGDTSNRCNETNLIDLADDL